MTTTTVEQAAPFKDMPRCLALPVALHAGARMAACLEHVER